MREEPKPIRAESTMNDDENNAKALESLIESLQAGRVVLFVGAGSSKRVGYPLWTDLIRDLRKRMQSDLDPQQGAYDEEAKDLLWEAQRIKEQYSTRLIPVLGDIFSPRDPRAFHRQLILLPCHRIITTNYDYLLESASRVAVLKNDGIKELDTLDWWDPQGLNRFIRRFHLRFRQENTREILHLHGSAKNWEKIIFTENDYVKFYGEDNPIKNLLWMMAASYPILFVGFGLSDWDLLYTFRVVRNRMLTEHPPHHAIVGFDPNEKNSKATYRAYLQDKYAINPIFYDVKQRIISKDENKVSIGCYETNLDPLMNEISRRLNLDEYTPHLLEEKYLNTPIRRSPDLQSDQDLKLMQRDSDAFASHGKESQ
jgi:hypothetical protein